MLLQRLTKQCQDRKNGEHGRNDKTVRPEKKQTDHRADHTGDCRDMIFAVQPLISKDYNKQCCHDKIHTFCIEVDQGTKECTERAGIRGDNL